MESIESRTVAELAAEMANATLVFERLGIDYCCGGQRKLADACKAAKVDAGDVIRELAASNQPGADTTAVDWRTKSLTELTQFIVWRYHVDLKNELPALQILVAKVHGVHGTNHPELATVHQLYSALKDELEPHMAKEEEILFPHIEGMEDLDAEPVPSCFGTVRNPIRMMMMEHDSAGDILKQLREVTRSYAVPADACNSYRSMMERLQRLEQDLHEHIHLENNVLFPRAIELEG